MKEPNYYIPERGFTIPVGEEGFTIYYYAIMIVLGVILATAVVYFLFKRRNIPGDWTIDLLLCILPIGKRAMDFCSRKGIEVVTAAFAEAGSVSVADCFAISDLITKGYLSGQFDEVSIVYTQFVSMLTQTPASESLLPLRAGTDEKREKPRSLVLYEPSPEEVYDAIVPGYIAGMIYGALCEAVTSEQGARRTAMEAASKNAAEMIEDLSLRYNRARQGAITQELTEIVAGAEH